MKSRIAVAVLGLLLYAGFMMAQTPPCPTGKTCSGSVTFTVTLPAPGTPASIAPTSVVAGAAATTVTLTAASGSAFNSQMVVEACAVTPTPCTAQTDLATTFVSASSITAVIPVTMLASSGTIAIYISQPTSAHATNLNWTAPGGSDPAATYNAYRSGTSGGPLTDPTRSSTPRRLPA